MFSKRLLSIIYKSLREGVKMCSGKLIKVEKLSLKQFQIISGRLNPLSAKKLLDPPEHNIDLNFGLPWSVIFVLIN